MSKNKPNPLYKNRNLLLEFKRQSKEAFLPIDERINNINKRLDSLVDNYIQSRINKGQIKEYNDIYRKELYDEFKNDFYNIHDSLNIIIESKNQ